MFLSQQSHDEDYYNDYEQYLSILCNKIAIHKEMSGRWRSGDWIGPVTCYCCQLDPSIDVNSTFVASSDSPGARIGACPASSMLEQILVEECHKLPKINILIFVKTENKKQ